MALQPQASQPQAFLRDFLTPKNPLGPARHERIIKRSEEQNSLTLIYRAEIFDHVLEEGRPIIVGRRGSGKTAIVSALLSRAGRDENYNQRHSTANPPNSDIYAFINSWDHLDELINKVGREVSWVLGPSPDWTSVLAETVSRHWARQLWIVIFQQIYRDSISDRSLRTKLPSVIDYIETGDIIPDGEAINDSRLTEAFSKIETDVKRFLRSTGRKCFIVIDSLEQYPVIAPRFQKVVSGLLKCVNDFADDNIGAHIYCCLPEEAEPFFLSSNVLKDFSPVDSVSRLRWKPIDLLRIVAERYRAFLILYTKDDADFIRRLVKFDFGSRGDLEVFYSSVMAKTVMNSLGREESAIAYIVRHTQLLPREFLMIFDAAIRTSHKMKGSWRFIESEAIVNAVESQEQSLSEQITGPYETLYPGLIDAARKVLPELPPICEMSDLDRIGARLSTRVEFVEPWEILFKIGVIGYIDDQDTRSGNCNYEYARFQFNSLKPITFANNRRYCVHPIFSGNWKLQRLDKKMKCVYPADVEYAPWDG